MNYNPIESKYIIFGSLHIKDQHTNFIWHSSFADYEQLQNPSSICGLFEVSQDVALLAYSLYLSGIAKIRIWNVLEKHSIRKVFASKSDLHPKLSAYVGRIPFDQLKQLSVNLLSLQNIRSVLQINEQLCSKIIYSFLYPNFNINPAEMQPIFLSTHDQHMMDVELR